jgi:hypothetical protein
MVEASSIAMVVLTAGTTKVMHIFNPRLLGGSMAVTASIICA